MTEFETQVAAALCYGHDAPLVLADLVNACRYCQDRAPRVAAAIEAAARDFGQDIVSAEQAALAALRGEP